MKNNTPSLPVPTESVEQQCLFRWAAFQSGRFPELALLYHVPNGGSRKKAEAGRFRAEGVKARMAARAFGDMFAAMGTALAACFSPALRGYVDDAKEREQKQADFSAAGNVFLPSTHEIIAGAQPEEKNTAARWWVKAPNPNYSKPQAEERRG